MAQPTDELQGLALNKKPLPETAATNLTQGEKL